MASKVPSLVFRNGYKMPVVGLGTWQIDNAKLTEDTLDIALQLGYRHIDTAFFYKNETFIGNVLKKWINAGKITREELFIVTKLPGFGHRPSDVEKYIKWSLKQLQLDYVDLYLIHWPFGAHADATGTDLKYENGEVVIDKSTDLVGVWKEMEKQVDAGRARSIGVSNFSIEQVERICKSARIKPVNNQIEAHVYLQQPELRAACERLGVTLCAYAPLGSPGQVPYYEKLGIQLQLPSVLNEPVLKTIAAKHKKTVSQICLKHLIQLGNMAVIPKSANQERLQLNIEVFDFELDSTDMKQLAALDRGEAGRLFDFVMFGMLNHPEYTFKK